MELNSAGVKRGASWRKLETRRWGSLRYREDEVIVFPRGLPGFEGYHRWAFFVTEEHQPFQWMISLEEPDVAFVVVDPLVVSPDYSPKVNPREFDVLELDSPEDLRILCIVTLGRTPTEATINLSGPVFINLRKKLGKQVVLLSNQYSTKYPVLGEKT